MTRWLAAQAEALGVEIYPGFAATEVLFGAERRSRSASPPATWGSAATASRKASFTRGMELRGKYMLLAEGARGSLTKQIVARYRLDAGARTAEIRHRTEGNLAGRSRQVSARPRAAQFRLAAGVRGRAAAPSSTITTSGWSSVGFVVHLNYTNPTLSPFDEFQRFKTHPLIARYVRGRQAPRLWRAGDHVRAAGSRFPSCVFPGGALIGCAAGFVNFARIKGSHNAMLSGMLAAEKLRDALDAGRANDELTAYEEAWRGSDIGRDLFKVRNVKPLWSKSRPRRRRRPRRPRHVDQRTGRVLAVRHLEARKAGQRDAEAPRAGQADRLSQARRAGLLRQGLVGVPVQHQSRRGPAGSPAPEGPGHPDPRQSAANTANRPGSIAPPASTKWSTPTRRRVRTRVSSSTRRTASTARPATSRIPPRTSIGRRPKAAAAPTIPTCDRARRQILSFAQNRHFSLTTDCPIRLPGTHAAAAATSRRKRRRKVEPRGSSDLLLAGFSGGPAARVIIAAALGLSLSRRLGYGARQHRDVDADRDGRKPGWKLSRGAGRGSRSRHDRGGGLFSRGLARRSSQSRIDRARVRGRAGQRRHAGGVSALRPAAGARSEQQSRASDRWPFGRSPTASTPPRGSNSPAATPAARMT